MSVSRSSTTRRWSTWKRSSRRRTSLTYEDSLNGTSIGLEARSPSESWRTGSRCCRGLSRLCPRTSSAFYRSARRRSWRWFSSGRPEGVSKDRAQAHSEARQASLQLVQVHRVGDRELGSPPYRARTCVLVDKNGMPSHGQAYTAGSTQAPGTRVA